MLGEQILELLRNSKPFTGIIDEIIMIYNIIKGGAPLKKTTDRLRD